jgi:UrcA family protein
MITANTGRNSALRTTGVLLAAIFASLASGMASAAQGDDLPHQLVSYKDLSLTTSAGAETLYKRIQAAAGRVCGSAELRELGKMVARKHCIDDAISRAVASVNSPVLTSIYLAKTGGTPNQVVASRR